MKKIKLEQDSVNVVVVEIGDESYSVPTFENMTYKETKALAKMREDETADTELMDWVVEYLKKYMPKKVVDNLKMMDIRQILHELINATGLDAGE